MTEEVVPPIKEDYAETSTADILKLYKGSILKLSKVLPRSSRQATLYRQTIKVLESVLLERCPDHIGKGETSATHRGSIIPRFRGF